MDWYLENPKKLEGQPKRTIADYVESNGILVPRRFDSLKKARKSHKAILLRSEHPQDYDGCSGVLESVKLSNSLMGYKEKGIGNEYKSVRGVKTLKGFKKLYFDFFAKYNKGRSHYQYCTFASVNEEQFIKDSSFSIWEKLRGSNRIVVADSSIPDRWHILTFLDDKKTEEWLFNYSIHEKDKPLQQFVRPLTPELEESLNRLIPTYEKIRNLDRFDPNHCPIMEFQTHKGRHYFLQYHRTRDFSPVDFVLDRKLKRGEKQSQFVRGATKSEKGMKCKVTVSYGGGFEFKFNPGIEEGSLDMHYNFMFPETQVRKRKLQINRLDEKENISWELMGFVVKHDIISKMFKPEVFLMHNMKHLLKNEKYNTISRRAMRTRKNQYIDLSVVSDGRKAYVKRI